MEIRKIYFYLTLLLVLPISLVSGFFNYITLKSMKNHWVNYPYEVTVGRYTPDWFTVLLHQLGPLYIIVFALLVTVFIGLVTYVFKPKYANGVNVTTLVVTIYFLVLTLAWLLVSMSVLARY